MNDTDDLIIIFVCNSPNIYVASYINVLSQLLISCWLTMAKVDTADNSSCVKNNTDKEYIISFAYLKIYKI